MRRARAEQHAVGHDHGGAAAGLEQAQEERQEEQLGLLGLDDLQQVLGGVLVVEAAGEGRIGQQQRVLLLLAGVVLGERVAVADVGVLDAVQQHVHAADAQHGVVEVEAVEHALVEVLAQLGVVQDARVVLAQVLAGRDQEARGAAGRVADDVGGLRRGELHHQPDDMARSAELAVLPGGGDLAEHVLVDVALGVAVLHRHGVDEVHDLGEQRRGRDGEARVLHVVRVGRVVAAQRAQEREDVLADHGVHVARGEVLEARPAQVVVRRPRPADAVLAFGEDPALQRLSSAERTCSPPACAGRPAGAGRAGR